MLYIETLRELAKNSSNIIVVQTITIYGLSLHTIRQQINGKTT